MSSRSQTLLVMLSDTHNAGSDHIGVVRCQLSHDRTCCSLNDITIQVGEHARSLPCSIRIRAGLARICRPSGPCIVNVEVTLGEPRQCTPVTLPNTSSGARRRSSSPYARESYVDPQRSAASIGSCGSVLSSVSFCGMLTGQGLINTGSDLSPPVRSSASQPKLL